MAHHESQIKIKTILAIQILRAINRDFHGSKKKMATNQDRLITDSLEAQQRQSTVRPVIKTHC